MVQRKKIKISQTCWLTSVISALWEARWVDYEVKRFFEIEIRVKPYLY